MPLPALVPILLGVAAQVGAPVLEKVLAGKIGQGNAGLVTDVVSTVARHAGATPEELPGIAKAEPERLRQAVMETERMTPELVALYASGVEKQFELMQAEMRQPVWTWAWRPLGMYGLGVLWLWNLIGLHAANAIWKIALPPADLSILMQLTGVYMALYMGGHTVKDLMTKRGAR